MLRTVSESAGVPIDQINLLAAILAHIPLSYFYRFYPAGNANKIAARKFYGAFVGILISVLLFGAIEVSLLVFSSLIFYFLSLKCNTRKITFKINLVNFLFLIIVNIWRLIVDYEGNTNNIMLLTMLVVPKQIYFNEFVLKHHINKLSELPSLFTYISYLYCFVGSLITPIYSLDEYLHFIHLSKYKELNFKWISKLGAACLFFIVHITAANVYGLSELYSKEFASLPIYLKALGIWYLAFFTRLKYYVGWYISEIPAVICELNCHEGKYENPVRSISFTKVEIYQGLKQRIEFWNVSIAKWLKHSFYIPLTVDFKLDRERASLLVFMLSALWHGFYPSYYVSFFLIQFVSQIDKMLFRYRSNSVIKSMKPFLDMFLYFNQDLVLLIFASYKVSNMIIFIKIVWPVYFMVILGWVALKMFAKHHKRHHKKE